MHALIAIVVATTGCSAVFGLEGPQRAIDAGNSSDAVDDAADDGGCTSFSSVLDTCSLTYNPEYTLTLSVAYDTDTHSISGVSLPATDLDTAAGPLTVVAFESLTLQSGSSLRIIGSRPAAIVVRDTISIASVIDVSDGGAGARSCGTVQAGENDAGGGGGGGGGGFAGTGGDGGDGDLDQGASLGGAGGTLAPRPLGPLGGCRGAKGGNGAGAANGGAGGLGGGALLIVAGQSIVIVAAGGIDVGGGGGGGGQGDGSGGGGGGSGGMILLESPLSMIQGVLVANGGGGGEGAALNDGLDGADGTRTSMQAQGGQGGAGLGANGGDGGAGLTPNGATVTQLETGGGGGGGGGVGFIAIAGNASTTGSTISPPFSVWP